MKSSSLQHAVLAECSVSRARTSLLKLPHYSVELPMFMPVGTQGTMKGLLPCQVKDANAQIILGNTYHLGNRPGKKFLKQVNGLHKFMDWDRALLTDSGGFQMVSLLKLAKITEEGVKFQSPYDGSECMLTPEESIKIQNAIGADIIMQLDDVVNVTETNYERFKEATYRTTRWLDRCIVANENPETQSLFPIIQGGTYEDLRKISLEQLISRDSPGYAIGGLSGGEDKALFWPVVFQCTSSLPKDKPRYCMGVGFPVDIVVCCAMGVDMFDCVHPTRTARFGTALTKGGRIGLKNKKFRFDFSPIDSDCDCLTCKNHTRAFLHTIATKEAVACHLLSIHNIAYIMRLMKKIRESIKEDNFVEFVKDFMKEYYPNEDYPVWVLDALGKVNIHLDKKDCITVSGESKPMDESNMDGSITNTKSHAGYCDDDLSGFRSSSYNRGFGEGVLSDFDESVEEGRIDGFKQVMDSSTVGISDGACSHSLLNDGNMCYMLSQWIGVLMCCSVKNKDLSAEDLKELNDMKLFLEKLRDESTLKLSEEAESRSEHRLKVDDCIERCRAFCSKLNFQVPNNI